MAANSKAKKASEVKDFNEDFPTQPVKQNPVETEEKKVKVRILTIICACYGTFMPGEVGEILESYVKELVECRKCEIIKD